MYTNKKFIITFSLVASLASVFYNIRKKANVQKNMMSKLYILLI